MTPEKQIEEQAANPLPQYNDVPPVRFGEKDDFDREIIADNIIKLLDSDLTDCYPMAIDGGWGTGKSEFCHKLINKMRDNAANYKPRNVIYFDAFEAENVEEPLLSLLAKITEVVPTERRNSVISKILPVMLCVGKVVSTAAINQLTKQSGEGFLEELKEVCLDETQKGIDRNIDELLKKYAHAKDNINALKKAIQIALDEKELVVFIDELDRCRPDFALNVFELVKHVFDIEGVKFIFVFNSEQIKSMIKNRYGENVDTGIYLEKFICRTIHLPSFSLFNGLILWHNAIKLIYEFGIKNKIAPFVNNAKLLTLVIENIYKHYGISLRAAEEIIKNFKIYQELSSVYRLNDGLEIGYEYFIIIGIFLYSLDKSVSENIIADNIDFSDITNAIGSTDDENFAPYFRIINDAINYGYDFRFQSYIHYKDSHIFNSAMNKLFGGMNCNEAQEIIIHVIKTLNFCG